MIITIVVGVFIFVIAPCSGQTSSLFAKLPGDVWVQAGGNATFRWEAAPNVNLFETNINMNILGQSRGPISGTGFIWYRGNKIPELHDKTRKYSNFELSATSIGFTIQNVDPQETGTTFQVLFFHDGGNVENSNATIVIDVAPSIPTVTQEPKNPQAGSVVILTCSAQSNIPLAYHERLMYSWRRAGVALDGTEGHKDIHSRDSQLVIGGVQVDDNEYSCVVRESQSQTSVHGTIRLRVEKISSTRPATDTEWTKSEWTISNKVSEDKTTPHVQGSQFPIIGETKAPALYLAWYYWVILALMGLIILIAVVILTWCLTKRRKKKSASRRMSPAGLLPVSHPSTTTQTADLASKSQMSRQELTMPSEMKEHDYSCIDSLYCSIDDEPRRTLPPVPSAPPCDPVESSYLTPRFPTESEEPTVELIYKNKSPKDGIHVMPNKQNTLPGMVRSSLEELGPSPVLTPGAKSQSLPHATNQRTPDDKQKVFVNEGLYPSLDNHEYLEPQVKEQTDVKSVEKKENDPVNAYGQAPHRGDQQTTGDERYLKLNCDP